MKALSKTRKYRPTRSTAFGQFMTGPGLPAFLITLTVLYEAFLLAVLFAPSGSGPWSGFATEFKVWCFSYDPRTGGMEWAEVWIMFLEPIFITGIVLLLWRRNLGELLSLRGWRRHRMAGAGAGAVGVVAMGGLLVIGLPKPLDDSPLPFPGERIRTRITPPPFTLPDQRGAELSLEDLRGHPVIITGIYAHCTTACPEILLELRNLVDELPAETRDQLRIVAFSLNPEYDTTEVMSAVAHAYNFTYPGFRYINGEPEVMRPLLSRYQFSPVYNPKTRTIDHANLFILLDAQGHIAFRFNLNPRHNSWLREAVQLLAAEAAGPSGLIQVAGR